MMPGVGLEPTCLAALRLKLSAYANSATRAYSLRPGGESHPCITVLQTVALLLRHRAITKA